MFYKHQNRAYDKWFISFLLYLRDFIINYIPLSTLPAKLLKLFYGFVPDFIFLVHPRRSQDIFIGFPGLIVFRKILPKRLFIKFICALPPKVIGYVKIPSGQNGLIVSTTFMPQILIGKRRKALLEARRLIKFCSKISKKTAPIGLGGWLPIVTGRGKSLALYPSKYPCTVTTGHTVTLLSIFLTIKKISILSQIPLSNLKISIVGAGKMGEKIAEVLLDEDISTISLVDINNEKLKRVEQKLLLKNRGNSNIRVFYNDSTNMSTILDQHHLAVCVSSSMKSIIKESDIPNNFIIIDDSRPEAVARDTLNEEKIVLEGGLMKIPGLISSFDFGLGIDDNVFGCLCEAAILAMDKSKTLTPTIGDVNLENFHKILKFCEEQNIHVGDFKNREKLITANNIIKLVQERNKTLLQNELLPA